MAYPVIRINNVTGSDTQASGAGPDPAIYGMQAATDAAGTTVDLSLDNPDLSGVATDGSHVIWLGGTGGIEFSQIIGVDNTTKTLTVADAFPASLSNLQWAIGGKRKSITGTAAYSLWSTASIDGTSNTGRDVAVFEVEDTGQDYQVSNLNLTLRALVRGVGGRPRIVVLDGSSFGLDGAPRSSTNVERWPILASFDIVSQTFISTGSIASYDGIGDDANYGGHIICIDLLITGFNVGIMADSPDSNRCVFAFFCGISDCNYGVKINGSSGYRPNTLYGCSIRNCSQWGVYSSQRSPIQLIHCIIANCPSGIRWTPKDQPAPNMLYDVTIVDCDNSIEMASTDWDSDMIAINVMCYGGSGYAIKFDYPSYYYRDHKYMRFYRHGFAFGGKTSGLSNHTTIQQLPSDIVLTEDPFVDRLNGNYALNDAPGGGKLLKGAGWPQTWPGLPNTTSYPDIGAVESQAGAGSSSGPPIPIPVPTRRGWI